jgi:hypothetical protein
MVFSTLRNGMRWNDLIKRLVTRDHAKIAARTLLERPHAGFQIANFGRKLSVSLTKLVVFRSLRCNRCLESTQLADTVLRQPNAVLEEHDDDEQG